MRPTRLLPTAALLVGLALVGCDKARPTLGGGANGKTACTGCHGGQLDATGAPPYDLAGHDQTWSTNALGVGAHYGHMSNAVGCFNCHKVPAAVSSPGHMGVPPAVVDFSSYVGANVVGAPAPLPWDRVTHTCSNYCHGSTLPGGTHTTPDWLGGTSEAACGSCHFFGGNIQTVQPAGHPLIDILAPGSPPITSNTQCADCHPETVNKDGTINVASGKHANGVIDGGGGHPSNFADPTVHGPLATAGLANCQVCHGTDFNGSSQTGAPSCNACHTAAGHPGWQSECTFCHGSATRAADATFPVVGSTKVTANLAAPPVGSQGETNTVQNAVGAHLAHVQAGALAGSFSCVQCHGAALPSDLTHVNGQVLLAWGNLAANGTSPSPAAGNIPRLVPDTSLPVGCANYCHGATLSGGANTAPKWTDGPVAATCGNCHSLPMPYTAAGGFHPPRTDCASCHPGYQSNPTTASGAGAVNVALHVNGKADTVTLACTTCHGSTSNPNGNAAPPVTTLGNTVDPDRVGAHQPHLATAFAGAGKGLACTECHPDNTGNYQHANGAVNLVWNLATTGGFSATPAAGALTPGTRNLSCSNYCHSPKPSDTAATNPNPVWSAPGSVVCGSCHGLPPASTTGHPAGATSCGSCHPGYGNTPSAASSAAAVNQIAHLNGAVDVINLVCTSCHGDATRTPVATANTLDVNGKNIVLAAPPVDSLGATSGNLVGAHQAHVNQGDAPALSSALLCSNCHTPVPTAAGPHITGSASPVVFGNLATSNGATPTAYSTATKTCSNTYCHGGFPLGKSGNSVSWGTGTNSKLACTACHGQGTTAAQPTYPHPQNTTCASCHTGYTSTTVNAATHVDGQLTVATGGCTSCHGDLKVSGVTLTANTVAAAPGETGSATSVDTTGATTTTSTGVGAHLAHLAKTDFRSAAIACTECHQLPASNTDTSHATGVGTGGARATIVFGNLASTGGVVPTYSEPTCSSTYCHRPSATDTAATNASPSWIAPGSVVCGSCHGLPPSSSSGHPVIAAGTSCGNCHTGYTTSSVNALVHINGAIDVINLVCTSCHGDATRTPVASANTLDVNGKNIVLAAPPVDSLGATSGNLVGAHQAHVNQGDAPALSSALLCSNCHTPVPTAAGPHISGTASPVVFGNLATSNGATPTAYSTATKTCSNTYCHGGFPLGKSGNSVSWGTGTNSKLACTACHGQGTTAAQPTYPHPQNTTCASCHTGYTSTTVNAATHVDGQLTVATGGCTSCHGDLKVSGVTLTANTVAAAPGETGSATSVDTTGATATTSTGVGAHLAHLAKTDFRSAAIACTECHQLPASNTDTSHATGVGTGGARATIVFGNLASTGGVVPTYSEPTCSSTYCHRPSATDTAATNASPSWIVPGSVVCGSCHGLPPSSSSGHPVIAAGTSCGNCHTGYTTSSVNALVHINGAIDVINLVCTSCHGDATRTPVASANTLDVNGKNIVLAAPPVDSLGATSGNLVGAHQAHVNQGDAPALSSALLCSNCHTPVPTAAGPHISGTASPVVFGNLATSNGATPTAYSTATKTCSNTYCHGGFPLGKSGNSVSWGTGTNSKLACTACHGQGTTAAQPTYPHPQNTTCASCHTGYTSTTVNAATHVDGQLTVATGGCTSCHGDLKVSGVTLTANTVAAAPGETGSATSVDTTGATATTSTGVGAHLAHLAKTDFRSAAIACTECHQLPASNTDTSHATGVGTGGARATIVFGNLASTGGVVPTYSEPTCSSTYCHRPSATDTAATNASPSWIAPGSVVCGSCHGLPPSSSSGHPVIAAGTSCGNCHPGYTTSSVNAVAHINGAIDVINLVCTSCHGDATRTPVASANTLDVNGKNIVLAAPPVDSLGATSGNLVGAHQAHVNQGDAPALSSALLCSNCHTPVPTAAGPHISGTASPVVFGNLATSNGATPTAYSTATKTCSNTYCHGGFPLGKSGNSVSWGTGTNSKLACTACHGQGTTAAQPTYPHPQNTTCASCHTGYTSTTVNAATHVDGQLTVATGGCTSCHGDLKVSGVTLTANTVAAAPGETGSATSVDTTGATATTSTGVGAHLAHLAKTDFRSAAIACTECHQLPASNTDTSHATGVGTGGARATIVFGNLASTGGVVPTYSEPTCSSTYCHRPSATDTAATNASPSWIVPGSVVCGSCHGLPPSSSSGHPVIAAGTSCGNCHPGYTTSSVNAVAHINGVIDGGSESTGGVACSGCHTDTWTAMTTSKFSDGTTVATHHTLGTLAGTNDSPNDTATTWSSPLNGVAASARSCVNMCHDDHTHTATDATNTTAHNRDVYLNASSQANRAATTRTVATKDVTDYENTATGGMCLSCHTNPVDTSTPVQHPALSQSAYQASAHQGSSTNTAAGTGTQPWAYTLHDGSQFVRNCTKCHDGGVQPGTTLSSATALRAVHGSPYPSLLAGTTNPNGTAATFICYECHGDNAGNGYTYSGKNVYATTVGAVSSHPVNADAVHSSVNEYANATFGNALGGATRHSSCLDCHDQHAAQKGLHTLYSNAAAPALQGAWGVNLTTLPANWTSPTSASFTKVTVTAGTTPEAVVCMKCHSSFYGTLPNAPSAVPTAVETDVALEFNPNNKSFHPVLATHPASNTSSTTGSVQLDSSVLVNGWTPGKTMTCTDCHGASSAAPAVQGPHGSANKFMLKGTNTLWPYTSATGTTPFNLKGSHTGLFCNNCHLDPGSSGSGNDNFHRRYSGEHASTSGTWQPRSYCISCHIVVPHGGKVSRLIVTSGGTIPASYKIASGVTPAVVYPIAQIVKPNSNTYFLDPGNDFTNNTGLGCSEHTGGGDSW